MKRLIIPALAIASIFSSCGQKHSKTENVQEVFLSEGKYYPRTDNVVNLTEDSLPPLEYFLLMEMEVPDKYKMPTCYMYDDSIMLIVTEENPSPYLITVMNYNTKEIIAEYCEYGGSRKKTKSMSIVQRKNYFNLKDYVKCNVSRLCMDSVIARRGEYALQWTSFALFNILDFDYVNDSTITWGNPEYIKGFGLKGIPNFVQTNLRGHFLAEYPRSKNIYTASALFRTMAINGSRYMEFWENYPVINVYDRNFRIEKQYRDTKFKDTELFLTDNSLMEKGVSLECFEFGCQTDKYVLVNNYRSSLAFEGNVVSNNDPAFGANHEIWFFDTNCNLVRRMRCKNLKGQVMGLSYCDKTGNLYMSVVKDKDHCAFYKCVIDK